VIAPAPSANAPDIVFDGDAEMSDGAIEALAVLLLESAEPPESISTEDTGQ